MDIIIDILIGLSVVAVVVSFVLGMVAFAKNGEAAAARANGWMAWRVRTQMISIGVLLLASWWKAAQG